MSFFIEPIYRSNPWKLDTYSTKNGVLASWVCNETLANQWDDFLASSPFGQFHQTSLWAQVRILDGWQPLIIVITLDNHIIGGFQILLRSKSYLGKIGLLLKGPVINSDDQETIKFLMTTLKNTVRKHKIRALIVQPSDRDNVMQDILRQSDFSSNYVDFVIKDNTVVVDLNKDEKDIWNKMKGNKRRNIKTALRMGAMVREGSRDELNIFFRLMLETCKRQNEKPSPSDYAFLTRLWDLFSPLGKIKLFVTECEGNIVSGYVVIAFCNTAYLWKFGWSGDYSNFRPNDILYWQIFMWAKANGYQYADVSGIGKNIAEKLWHGEAINECLAKTYSYFKVGFGGDVLPLSKGFVYFPNPIIRLAYNLLMPYINAKPAIKNKLILGK